MEYMKEAALASVDPSVLYEKALTNDTSCNMKFIPDFIVGELSKKKELAEIMLNHPYYNIRRAYARVATDATHLVKLSEDKDWRVLVDLLENKALPEQIFERLRTSSDVRISAAAEKVREIRSLARK